MVKAGRKIQGGQISVINSVWQMFLIIIPWLLFWLMEEFYAALLTSLFGPVKVPTFVACAPFEVLLIVGIIIAWKRNFPLWSYTWIGILYFFGYREIFQIVLQYVPSITPEYAGTVIFGFYWIINPLALAFLLALITRRDWLLACLVGYPYTSIIQAWYTLDWAKISLFLLLASLVLYLVFAFLFVVLKSRTLKFVSLLVGTLIIGGGFFLHEWGLLIGGLPAFVFVNVRHILIITFPLIIYQIPLYHKLFRTQKSLSTEKYV